MQSSPEGRRRYRWDGPLAVVALLVVAIYLAAPPHGVLEQADHAAFAVCHRIAARSFVFAGRPLPLCARCSGTYLGALAGLAMLIARGRGRAAQLPARRFLIVLGLFLLAWIVDGANSFLTFFPSAPHLYAPQNVLRLATGTLEGLALAAVLLPIFNLSVWADPAAAGAGQRSLETWRDLAWLLVGGALVVALVSSEWRALLYPLALLSEIAILGLIGTANALLVLSLLHREGRAEHWREVAAPLAIGLALAVLELAAIAAGRAVLTARLGLPF